MEFSGPTTTALPANEPQEAALTKRQGQVLRVIESYIASHGYAPSIREIAEDVGLASPATVKRHLAKLEEQGLVQRSAKIPRSLRLPRGSAAPPVPFSHRTGTARLQVELAPAERHALLMGAALTVECAHPWRDAAQHNSDAVVTARVTGVAHRRHSACDFISGPNGARTRRALQIDSSVPSSARVWNYWQGGKDHYEVDRVAAEAYRTIAPSIKTMARESRAFLSRAVTFATAELGVRQFLDVGTGLPAGENTHEIAQRIAPQTKVVYVDSDPLVLVHARALLRSTPEGAVLHLPGDLHEPEPILAAAAATFLDFNQPIALLLMGVLGHIQNYDEACLIVRRLMTALPVGSCLIHYDAIATPKLTLAQIAYNTTGAIPYALRTADQIAAFYEGLDVLAPGIVPCSLWRPHPGHRPAATDIHGGIARKL